MTGSTNALSKKLLLFIMMVAMAFTVISVFSAEDVFAANQHFKVSTEKGLHLRKSTDANSKSLCVIPYNTTIKITSYKKANGYDWGKTSYNNKTGWVAMKYVRPSAQIADGIYTLSPKCAPKMVIDVSGNSKNNGANVQLWDPKTSNAGNQQVQVKYLYNGFYQLTFVHSGKALDVAGGKAASKTNVQQYSVNSSYAQQWQIISGGDGYYILSNRVADKALDADNRGTKAGTNVWVYDRNNTTAQLWKFNDVTNGNSSKSELVWPAESAYYVTTLNYYWNNGSPSEHGTRWGWSHAIDIGGGGNIISAADGTVESVSWQKKGFGNYVVIKHNDGNRSLYGHLKSVSVKKGSKVSAGQIIGVMGKTGDPEGKMGIHLHFEIEKGNPMDVFKKTVANKLIIGTNVYKANNAKRNSHDLCASTADWIKENYTIKNGWYVHK